MGAAQLVAFPAPAVTDCRAMKRSIVGALLAGVLLSGAARAQAPEDEWGGYTPVQPPPPPPAATLPGPPPPPLPPPVVPAPQRYAPALPSNAGAPVRPRPEILDRVRLVEERNEISMAAPTLGAGKRGQSLTVGFPLITLRVLFGLGDHFDLGVGYDTYYFLMHEPRAVFRVGLLRSENWSLTATLEGGYAFFLQRASRESQGSRFLTGRRNINVNPSLAVAWQGNGPRAARVFFSAHYLLALDTEPYATDPLVGVPPAVVAGHNGGLRGGAELPLSPKTAFTFSFGMDFHGRADDTPVLPSASVGLVTSL